MLHYATAPSASKILSEHACILFTRAFGNFHKTAIQGPFKLVKIWRLPSRECAASMKREAVSLSWNSLCQPKPQGRSVSAYSLLSDGDIVSPHLHWAEAMPTNIHCDSLSVSGTCLLHGQCCQRKICKALC